MIDGNKKWLEISDSIGVLPTFPCGDVIYATDPEDLDRDIDESEAGICFIREQNEAQARAQDHHDARDHQGHNNFFEGDAEEDLNGNE